MSNLTSRLTLNQRLAALTFALGAIALFAKPYQGSTVTIDTKTLAVAVATGADQIAPQELASWTLAGRADYRLIDIRSEAEFAAARIPGAENLPAAVVFDGDLARNETIVIYGDDGAQTAKVWLLLRAKGYRGARLLKGGLAAWTDQVLFPTVVENPTPEQKTENDRLAAIAAYFGGQARVAGEGTSAMPYGAGQTSRLTVAPPPAPVGKSPVKKKKKKEGC